MIEFSEEICNKCLFSNLEKNIPEKKEISKIKIVIVLPYLNSINQSIQKYISNYIYHIIGLQDNEYYMTTGIKCAFNLKNKEPDVKSMELCKFYLEKELAMFNNNVLILAVGKIALRQLIKGNLALDAVAGSIIRRPTDNKRVFTLYYPNFIKKSTYLETKFQMHAKSIKNLLMGNDINEEIFYECIFDKDKLQELIIPYDTIALDIETTGLLLTNTILTVAIGTDEKIWLIDCTKFNYDELKNFFKSLENKKLICHNAEFDLKFINYTYNLDLQCYVDTLQLEHILDEEAIELDLQNVLKRYFLVEFHKDVVKFWDYSTNEINELFFSFEYKWIKQRSQIYLYNVKDTYWTYKLHKSLLERLENDKNSKYFYFSFTIPLLNSVIYMSKYGIPIDVTKLYEVHNGILEDIKQKENELISITGNFNFRSTQQLASILKGLGITEEDVGKTEKGAMSLNKESLETLSKRDDKIGNIARLLLEIRALEKLKTAYISQIQNYIYVNKYTNINSVLSSFKIHASKTYRCNSENINIHNIPRGSIIKKLFVAPKDYVFLGFDYQSAEAFHVAKLSGEEKVIDFVMDPTKDQHKYTASFIFKKQESEITKEERTMAKLGWFCLQYGGTEHALMRDFKMSLNEALNVVKGIKNAYPKLFGFMDTISNMAKNNKIIINRFGASRRFPIWQPSSDKHAMNYPIQSEVSIYTHLSAIDLVKISRFVGPEKFRVLYTIHDAIYSITHHSLLTLVCAIKKKVMELSRKGMFLLTDPEVGPSWYDLRILNEEELIEYQNYMKMDLQTLISILNGRNI